MKCTYTGGCNQPATYREWYIGCQGEYCAGHPSCTKHANGDAVIHQEEETMDSQNDDRSYIDIHEFQDLGEAWRQNLGIDGTAGDAQDEDHPFIPANPGGPCVVCGLAASYRRHVEK